MAEGYPENFTEPSNLGESRGCCGLKWCWWNPHPEAIVAEFCNETSLHGLQYIGQPKRHIFERIFWILAFVIGVTAAGFLVHAMIQRYEDTPVVVSFQSKEQQIDTIPFPAVTFCNINQFSKKKVLELERIAGSPTHEYSEEAKRNISLIYSICRSQKSFTQFHDYSRGQFTGNLSSDEDSNSIQNEHNMLDFLVENTISCNQMIPLCMFDGAKLNCSEEFQTVITALGKCCTFNMMPLPFILKNPSNEGKENISILNNPALGSHLDWDKGIMNEWSKWDYEKGFMMPQINVFDMKSHLFYPIRQWGPGKPYGFSMLIDPNSDDYFCPMSDAEGMVFTLHTSIEIPHVKEFPSVLDTNKEIYIKVNPEVTFADPDIRDLTSEKRQCYFGKEQNLKLFRPYSRTNCITDCIANRIAKKCNCSYFYMPRAENVRICNTDVESQDGKCVEAVNHYLRTSIKRLICGHCLALCEELDYKYETTMVGLQNLTQIWSSKSLTDNDTKPDWANHKVSIVHIFFGTESTVPKLRKRLYGVTDLIANAGGILGLCLGFSVLSAVEMLYFVLVRALWKNCDKRNIICGLRRRTKPAQSNSAVAITENVDALPTP